MQRKQSERSRGWQFFRREKICLIVAAVLLLGYGALLERRTGLRKLPSTDLGVFCFAAGAVKANGNPYAAADWHGWHYHYPPMLAILFRPLALQPLKPGWQSVPGKRPWGIDDPGQVNFYGYHEENARFVWIVLFWYLASLAMFIFSLHAAASILEGARIGDGPPTAAVERRNWWLRRLIPLIVCIGSIGTELSRGQVDVLMLFAIVVGLYAWGRDKQLAAGAAFAIPAAIKLFPPLLLLLPALRRRWRMFAGVLAGFLVCLYLLPLATLGAARTHELYRVWFDALARPALGKGEDQTRAAELTNMNATDNQSLLQAIHNWKYLGVPRDKRSPAAEPWERTLANVVGYLFAFAVLVAVARYKQETARRRVIAASLLVGVAFVCSPIVHNYYYVLLLPLVAAFVDAALDVDHRITSRRAILALAVFALVDVIARLPGVGPLLRDLGLPLLTLVGLLAAAAWLLTRDSAEPVQSA